MRIGHFNRAMFEAGGTTAYVRQIGTAQAAMGHEVVFYDDVAWRPLEGTPAAANARALEVAANSSAACLQYVHNAQELYAAANRHKLDVLHLHCDIAYAGRPSLVTVRTIHNHQPYCPSGSRFLARSQRVCECRASLTACLLGHLREHCGSLRPASMKIGLERTRQEQRFLRHIPSICISEYMKREMVSAGYPESLLQVILHAAPPVPDEEPIPLPPGPARFVYMGRLTPLKGLATLIHALHRAKTTMYLDIAGSGPQEAELRQQAQALGLEDRVCFHSWLEREQTRSLLCRSRALVFPSVWPEPAGLVTLEASALGRAVIGTRAGGLPEYALEGQNALLVPPGDPDALSAALVRLATDRKLAGNLGMQGRKLAREHFTLDRHCAQLHRLYAHCVEDWNSRA